jgi:phosphatidate phosphatase PAH1
VIDRTSHLFKTEMLLELQSCFTELSRDCQKLPVFVAGFGNKDTDAIAYEAAGIPKVTIFIVDTRSNIRVGAGYNDIIRSYEDPNMVDWIFEMVTLIKDGKLPKPPVRTLR